MMTRFLSAVVIGTLVAWSRAVAGVPATADWRDSALLAGGLRHSDIALMPEGTPADDELFRPLRPTVVAWGEDALPTLDGGASARSALARRTDDYRRLGVRDLATNVWMLTATERFIHGHPDYADAVCIDLWGQKILPRWLADADFQGVKPWWGCTNHPLFAEQLRARMLAGLAAGASMVHLDDHAGTAACAAHAGGCFCEYCLRGFREWLARNVGGAELVAAGVDKAGSFDYRAFLLRRGYADRTTFISESWKGRVPLWSWFLAFQREAAVKFIAKLQAEAARAVGRPVAFGVNAYNLEPSQLFDAHAIDYFANEVEQFDREDLIPPVVYRLGEALGRPVFATGTGEDWIAYRQSRSTVRVRRWIAQAYAFGQYFMYSWKKWGFSDKTGTLWTEVDPEVFRPMVRFVSSHPELFDDCDNAAAVGLLYDNASANAKRWAVREVSRELLDDGVPYGLVVSGDGLLRKPLTAAALKGFRTLVVPADVIRTDELKRMLTEWKEKGGQLIEARESRKVDAALPGRIEVTSGGRVWALPRVRRGDIAPHTPALIVHLLNRDYDATRDAMNAKTGVRLVADVAALGGPVAVHRVRYFQPEAEPRELEFVAPAAGKLSVVVPSLDIWGVLLVE